MKSRIQPGNVVYIFKIECEGEITKVEADGSDTRYFVRIPVDDDIFIYRREDLHVFSKTAEENIRREWKEEPA